MGKIKRQARKHSNHHDTPRLDKPKIVRRQHSHQQKSLSSKHAALKANNNGQIQARPKIPFDKHDDVLLVGEGDFSFALALKEHHTVGSIVATCYDSRDVLVGKYPHVQSTISKLDPSTNDQNPGADDSVEWRGLSPSPTESSNEDDSAQSQGHSTAILYGIDATKLSSVHKKALKPHCPFTKIVFNFPHVGGLSTDVNRQVRYNQELLVGFFKSAKPLLSSLSRPAKVHQEVEADPTEYGVTEDAEQPKPAPLNGQILVTIFEGEPYTLWNVRDLARHCGMKVVESFKFPWSAYPGYQHARTIGDITSGKDRSDKGKRKGAWRGEERAARCYMLEDAEAVVTAPSRKKRKRQDAGGDSD